MTDYKERVGKGGTRSLYLGLLLNIVLGCILVAIVYCVTVFPARSILNDRFVTSEKQRERRAAYVSSLAYYVHGNEIDIDSVNEINGWIRSNPYVYLLVYKHTDDMSPEYSSTGIVPNPKAKPIEHSGSRISEYISRQELMANATEAGYYKIVLPDGEIVVAIYEYTENFYYSIIDIVGIVLSVLVFLLVLLGYIRVLIERIKRFEGDVTIVSEVDMNYEIVSEGRDEIANLSTRVETMRQRMLDHIKSEQEAREANTELITSISHDIRTPLTVLMGYIEMMKEQAADDKVMQSYIYATENTALRLKNMSDDMFKYSLAFGDTQKSVRLEEYDLITLGEQLFSEHFVLMRENGYDIQTQITGEKITEGTTVRTDAANLMRIVDNIFSNIRKYADKSHPVTFNMHVGDSTMTLECKNIIRTDTEGAESNGIGLKTCVRLGSLVARKFEYKNNGEEFLCRLVIDIKRPDENEK